MVCSVLLLQKTRVSSFSLLAFIYAISDEIHFDL